MSFLPDSTLRQQLAQAIRSGGQGGLTTAQDVRTYLGLLLDELAATQGAKADLGPDGRVLPAQLPPGPDPADVVHLAGAETITGLKTFTGDVLLGNGQDGSGLKIRKPSGEGYQRLLDVTNVDQPNSINFGAVGEGGDLRYHGTSHRWLANGGGPARMLLDEQSALTVAGPVRAAAFVGDGAQLTSLPTGPRCTATGLAQVQYTGSPTEFVLPFSSATGTGYDVNSHRFAPGKAGFYGITMGGLVSNTSVGGELYLGLKINAARYVMVQHWQSAVAGPKGGGTGYVEIELGATDVVEALLLHDNGGQPYQVFDAYYQTFFSARWLGY